MSDTNPNVEVGSEGKASSAAGGSLSWDEVEQAVDKKPAKTIEKKASGEVAEKKDKPAESGKGKADAKADKKSGDDAEDKTEDGGADGKAGKASEKKAGEERPEADSKPAKPRSHKFRSGDESVSLSSDSVVAVQVAGKKEEVKLQDLIDEYSGKTDYSRKYGEFSNEKRQFDGKVKKLNEVVTKLHSSASEDPEAAFDFLAEFTGKDPVELKATVLKKNLDDAFAVIKAMGYGLPEGIDQEVEKFLGNRKLDWDKKHVARQKEKLESDGKARAAEETVARERQRYAISDDEWSEAETVLRKTFEANKIDKEIAPEDIVHAHRHILAVQVIEEKVPHLAKHPRISDILNETVTELVKDPSMSREQLGEALLESFGERDRDDDDSALRRVGEKVQKRQGADASFSARKPAPAEPPLSWDDL